MTPHLALLLVTAGIVLTLGHRLGRLLTRLGGVRTVHEIPKPGTVGPPTSGAFRSVPRTEWRPDDPTEHYHDPMGERLADHAGHDADWAFDATRYDHHW